YRLHVNGITIRKIAKQLGRSPSTISRELKRNSKVTKQWTGSYKPIRADHLALRRRRWDGRFKLTRQPALRALVRNLLIMGWSPEQIAGRLAREHSFTVISHESIYRFIYHRTAQKDYWHRLLPRARFRRGKHSRRVDYALNHLKNRRSVHDKTTEERNRSNTGHWEADLMLFGRHGQAVLVNYDRKSRLVMATRQNKSSQITCRNLKNMVEDLPRSHRKTMTFDNGTEFAKHHILEQQTSMKSYFCDIRSPWQKGGVENSIGRLLRLLPIAKPKVT
ncbi:MAG: IS30 family transposase, partial [Alphaproteobacteria bacterium]|nr:IS30 family transposase [Alphaproteobacteria bacterium]